MGDPVGRVEARDRTGKVGTTADGATSDLWLKGFLLPNNYSPAQTWALD